MNDKTQGIEHLIKDTYQNLSEVFDKVNEEIKSLKKRIKELEKENESLKNENDFFKWREVKFKELEEEEAKPKYLDSILMDVRPVDTATIAKDYGMSEDDFNGLLEFYDIHYKSGDVWFLCDDYAGHDYTMLCSTKKDDGTYYQMNWTPKGREFLYETLKYFGVLPLMEREEDYE